MNLHPIALSLALLTAASAVPAQTPLTAEEFDARTQGRTLYFYSEGRAYGAERYKPDRRVVWTFLDGECKDGRWYSDGPLICFEYEELPTPQCWTFYAEGNGLRALFNGEEGASELYEAGEADEELLCHGPRIGV